MFKVATVEQTCSGCPSQWEGRTTDDRPFYIRYRWGYLSIRLGSVGGSLADAWQRGEQVFGKSIGDGMDGVIEWEKVCLLSGISM